MIFITSNAKANNEATIKIRKKGIICTPGKSFEAAEAKEFFISELLINSSTVILEYSTHVWFGI